MGLEGEALELETRKKIYETVKRFPGLHLREIARQLDMSVPLVDYHLNFLEKYGLVTGVMDAQFKRFYPRDPIGSGIQTDRFSIEEKKVMGVLRQRIPLQIVLLLLKEGTVRHKDMLPLMGVSPSTLSHHIGKLLRRNVIRRTEEGFMLTDPEGTVRLLMKLEIPPGSLSDAFARVWEELRL
jgi:predicted transcriptional regulator